MDVQFYNKQKDRKIVAECNLFEIYLFCLIFIGIELHSQLFERGKRTLIAQPLKKTDLYRTIVQIAFEAKYIYFKSRQGFV